MKKFVAIFMTVTLLFSLSACNLFTPDYEMPDKEFVYDGVKITLTEGFREDDVYEDGVWYESKSETSVTLDKLAFSGQNDPARAYSIAEFAALMASELGCSVKTVDGMCYLEDPTSSLGFDFMYFYAFHKNEEAFWMITCICDEEDYETYKPYFLKWASSVEDVSDSE